ncbi:16S rRNA (guanine(527)-N(7))-methyltransferase RsmG [[Mycoplasma] testudinis]|uniref:16S rRNA (guanine(527)-N(7))-methyltransferase RsmG n=1 Tax=[Mycoplasma] testudinis TaxID=33924 RepID=UPI0004845910|nr:16S rRNA (guanine(527)-N(7))-methyltransferase RsmG [[Mycoplasma] testudinis]
MNNKEYLLNKYVSCVHEFNQRFNLTGFKNEIDIKSGLVDEVVQLIPFLSLPNAEKFSLIDVGSGSGSPGIVLAIHFPLANFFLIEPNQKKATFLQILVTELQLKNVFVKSERAESLNSILYREKFDYGLSRAVASIKIMNELICQWIKVNGKIIHLKSLNYLVEVNEAKNELKSLGLKYLETKKTMNQTKTFNNIIYQKIQHTPTRYPRPWKQIISKVNYDA